MQSELREPEYSNNVRERIIALFQFNEGTGYRDIQRKTGLERKKVERSMNEGRHFKEEEVEILASYFGITLERLGGKEYRSKCAEINVHMNGKNFERALEVSQYLFSVSLTKKEQRYSEFKIAEAHMGLKDYSSAIKYLRRIIDCSNNVEDFDLLIDSRHLFLKTLILQGEYTDVRHFTKTWFEESLKSTKTFSHLAKLKHFEGMSYFYEDKKDNAKMHYLHSINLHKESGDKDSQINAARLQANVADIEFHSGRYTNALKLLDEAENVQTKMGDQTEQILITKKDKSRCLIVLGHNAKAIDLIKECLEMFASSNIKNDELKGKFLLMLSDADSKTESCEEILLIDGISEDLRANAADCILTMTLKGGGLPTKIDIMYCYEVVRGFVGALVNYRKGVWF